MITPDTELGAITQEELDKYLKDIYKIGNNDLTLPTEFDAEINYPNHCISYNIDGKDYYLLECVYYDAFSGCKTYYLINASVTLNDPVNNGETSVNFAMGRYLKPVAGDKCIWTEWSSEDPYIYNFLKACGGSGSGSGSSQVILRKWVLSQ